MQNNKIADTISKHALNLLKVGLFMTANSIITAGLKSSTSTTLEQVVKDVKRARNSLREQRELAS